MIKKVTYFKLMILIIFMTACNRENEGVSYSVNIVDPPFNNQHIRYEEEYKMLTKADEPWHIAVAIPHLKDDYWTGVVYGLIDTGRSLGISMEIVEAGGYEYLDVQREQIKRLINDVKPDGLIISSVSYTGLNDLVEMAKENNIHVIDLINGIESPSITSRVASNFVDHGRIIAETLVKSADSENRGKVVGWFPGPEGAGWVDAANRGFLEVMNQSGFTVYGPNYGDTGHTTQETLLKAVLEEHSNIEFIAGTAVTAEVAASVLRSMKLSDKVSVSSFYYSSGVHRGILGGEIVAAPTDLQAVQARIAVDTVIRAIEGKSFYRHIEPRVYVVDSDNISEFDSRTSLAPSGFRIIMSISAP